MRHLVSPQVRRSPYDIGNGNLQRRRAVGSHFGCPIPISNVHQMSTVGHESGNCPGVGRRDTLSNENGGPNSESHRQSTDTPHVRSSAHAYVHTVCAARPSAAWPNRRSLPRLQRWTTALWGFIRSAPLPSARRLILKPTPRPQAQRGRARATRGAPVARGSGWPRPGRRPLGWE